MRLYEMGRSVKKEVGKTVKNEDSDNFVRRLWKAINPYLENPFEIAFLEDCEMTSETKREFAELLDVNNTMNGPALVDISQLNLYSERKWIDIL